ncbi:MAG: hypothetical protein ACI4QF_07995 [Kiritimatiellia bacterium]
MKWTVTYRDKEGKPQALELDGENRGVVFSELRKRGITPLNVIEGAVSDKKGKDKKKSKKEPSETLLNWVIVLLLFAVIGVALWCILPSDVRSSVEQKARPAGKISIQIAD